MKLIDFIAFTVVVTVVFFGVLFIEVAFHSAGILDWTIGVLLGFSHALTLLLAYVVGATTRTDLYNTISNSNRAVVTHIRDYAQSILDETKPREHGGKEVE